MQRMSGQTAIIGSVQPRRPAARRRAVASTRVPVVEQSAEVFRALTPDERAYLQYWLGLVLPTGIDMVEDLMARPWPHPIADTIIGVFRSGEELAAWMVIGRDGVWAVASCSDGKVSREFDALSAALSHIHPVDDSA